MQRRSHIIGLIGGMYAATNEKEPNEGFRGAGGLDFRTPQNGLDAVPIGSAFAEPLILCVK